MNRRHFFKLFAALPVAGLLPHADAEHVGSITIETEAVNAEEIAASIKRFDASVYFIKRRPGETRGEFEERRMGSTAKTVFAEGS